MISNWIYNLKIKILISFAVWLLFAAFAVIIGLCFTDALTYARLSKGVGVWGRVTAKEPENHQIVRYTYIVGQQSYSGIGHDGRGNPPFGSLKIGDRVVVFYDPAHPSQSCMGYPQAHLKVEMAGIIFLVLTFSMPPLVMVIILMIAISKSQAMYNNC